MVHCRYKPDGKDEKYKMDENHKWIVKQIWYFLDERILIYIKWKWIHQRKCNKCHFFNFDTL